MLKAVIFDMDGVLVNTPRYVTIAFNKILDNYGIQLTKKDRYETLGRSLKDQIGIWKEKFGIKEHIDPIEFSKTAFKTELELMKNDKVDISLINFIEELKKKDIMIIVATSSTKERAFQILENAGLIKYFNKIITAEDVKKHKPDPEIFLKATEILNVNPENCVVIEDAKSGVEAGKNAGMKVIGKLSEYFTKDDLKDADLLIREFDELSYDRLKVLF